MRVLWLAAGLALGACGGTPDRPPHVLLISIDSLRPDHLGAYGYRAPTGVSPSPVLDDLAKDGAVFENAVSTTSWTLPSHHALMSGLPDMLHGAFDDLHGVTPDRVVLPQVLQEAGYRTEGYFTGPYLHPVYGFGVGFDHYENVTGEAMTFDLPEDQRPDLADLERTFHEVVSSRALARKATGFLRKQDGEQPFFLFLHFFDTHYDYRPPEERMAERFRARPIPTLTGSHFLEDPRIAPDMDPADKADVLSYYDGEIHWVDSQIGVVLDALKDQGLDENTLVVVVSDHGDEFFEHGEKGHRQNLYDETLRAAMLVREPGRVSAGTRVQDRVSLVDVAPTILGRVHAAQPLAYETSQMFGSSLWPLLDGDTDVPPREAVGYLFEAGNGEAENHWALWTGDYKVLLRAVWAKDSARQRPSALHGEVYDLRRDPGEQNDLSRSQDPAVLRAIRRFDEVQRKLYEASGSFRAGKFGYGHDEAERKKLSARLKQLGYLEPTSVKEQPPPPPFPRKQP